MIVLDTETSGISAIKHGMLSLGAVHFRSGQKFYGECRLTAGREITPIALQINGFTEEQIRDERKDSDARLLSRFFNWAQQFEDGKLLGGHNVGHFDIIFLEEIASRMQFGQLAPVKFPFSYRTVDLHSIAYAKFGKSLTHEQICVELGLEPEPKPHNALQGALSEAAALKILLT